MTLLIFGELSLYYVRSGPGAKTFFGFDVVLKHVKASVLQTHSAHQD